MLARSSREVIAIGSTILILNGSGMYFIAHSFVGL